MSNILRQKNKKVMHFKCIHSLKDHCIDKKVIDKDPEACVNKIIIGELYSNPHPEYTESYKVFIDKFQG